MFRDRCHPEDVISVRHASDSNRSNETNTFLKARFPNWIALRLDRFSAHRDRIGEVLGDAVMRSLIAELLVSQQIEICASGTEAQCRLLPAHQKRCPIADAISTVILCRTDGYKMNASALSTSGTRPKDMDREIKKLASNI